MYWEEIKDCVKSCDVCQSFDPAPVRTKRACLGVTENSCRLAVNVTHIGKDTFLSVVDCRLGRLAIK